MPGSSAEPTAGSIRLQPLTRHRVAAMGAEGTAWLTGLPEVLAALEHDWSVTSVAACRVAALRSWPGPAGRTEARR